MSTLKTYALKLRAATRISGVDYQAGEQVGAITCEISPFDLLGLVQHHHAELVEVTDEAEADVAEEETEEQADASELSDEPAESTSEGDADADADSELPEEETEAEETSAEDANSAADAVAAFVADGLDEKTATSLVVANGIMGPEALRAKMSEPDFNLDDLDEIGPVRVKKIEAIYLK